jgi:uncharacterized protein (DUF302 family)
MKRFLYTVDTTRSLEDAVQAVERKVAEKGFRVVHTYDVGACLAAEGFHHGPLKILGVCNAHYANDALEKDINVALMLPCQIAIYTQGGKTFIGTMLPSAMVALCPAPGLDAIASEVEKSLLQIVDEARG